MTVPCENPVEIDWVKSERKRRNWGYLAIVLAFLTVAGSIISGGLFVGAMANDVEHLQADQDADRRDIRQARADLLEQERRTHEQLQTISQTLIRLETKMEDRTAPSEPSRPSRRAH